MEFLGKLGIDIRLLIAQIINFGLLLWLLNKFLYRPIIERIEKDEAELARAKKLQEEFERQKNVLQEQEKQETAEAKERARQIIKEAEDVAQEVRSRAQKQIEEEKL